ASSKWDRREILRCGGPGRHPGFPAHRVDWHAPSTPEPLMRPSLLALVATLLLVTGGALAQDYPTRPVKIIVPFAAGGPADVYARFLAQRLQESMGQPFVVENRPAAGALSGTGAA